jgi:ATP-dependent Lon protease
MLLVDEIDKAGTSRYNGNLVSSILPMLEQETAKRFADPYVQAPADVSHVSYVLTANSELELPKPLKDRCRILRMPMISVEHVPAIAIGIVKVIASEKGLDSRWVPPLDGDEIEIAQRLLGDGSIRRLRAVVERLLAKRETNAARN